MGNMQMNAAALATVFSIAFFSLWASIPAGLALGLNVFAVVITASVSYAIGVAVVVLPGERVKNWLLSRFGKKAAISEDSLIFRAWKRFGAAGLGLLAPVTVGAQIGAVIGLTFNAPPRQLLFWMSIGGVVWSIIVAAAISLGLVAVQPR
jgi:hypothetical protein